MSEQANLHQREDVKSTIRTMSLGTVWRVMRYPFILLSMAIIPRMMGDTDYGRYAYFISLFVILDMLTDLGFLQVFGRFVPEYEAKGDRARLLGLLHGVLVFGVLLALMLVVGLALFYAMRPFSGFDWEWIVLLSLMLLLTRIEGTLFSFLYGLSQIARFSAKEVLRSACTLLLVVMFYWRFGLSGALWALVVNELILCGLSVWWTREYVFHSRGQVSLGSLRPYLIFGVGFYIPGFLFGLLQRSGNVLVQNITHSSEQVAYYDIANQYLLLTATFLGLILQTLLPSLTRLHIEKETVMMERWQRTIMTYCAILAFMSFNALMWLGELLVVTWLGEAFRPVMDNATIIAIAIVPILIAYAGMNYSLIDKKPGVYLCGVGVGMAVMAGASYLLIPKLGSVGAAWGTVFGYSALGVVFLIRYIRMFIRILPGFVAAVVIALLFLPVYQWGEGWRDSILLFIATSVVYPAILFLLRIIRWKDLQKIRDAFKRRKNQES